jgi:predicted RNase H-like HicB family nuclease
MKKFTLEYWKDDEWYVGKLKEVPGVFSQGESLEELEENIRDAYRLMMQMTRISSPMSIPLFITKRLGWMLEAP